MEVKEAMVTTPVSITVDNTLAEAASAMRDSNVGSLVVLDKGRVVGIITDRDITTRAVAISASPDASIVADYMSEDPITVPPHVDVTEALDLMRRRKVKRLPVVFAGKLEGIIAAADIAATLEPANKDLVSTLQQSRHNV